MKLYSFIQEKDDVFKQNTLVDLRSDLNRSHTRIGTKYARKFGFFVHPYLTIKILTQGNKIRLQSIEFVLRRDKSALILQLG